MLGKQKIVLIFLVCVSVLSAVAETVGNPRTIALRERLNRIARTNRESRANSASKKNKKKKTKAKASAVKSQGKKPMEPDVSRNCIYN